MMSVKRKLFEMLIGHELEQEYLNAARERYEEVVKKYGQGNFPSDEEIMAFHVSSPHKAPNTFKVKSRMLISKDFVIKNIKDDVDKLSFLDVGGSSDIFFQLLGVSKDKGCTVNVIKDHVSSVVRTGYRGIIVGSEALPFKDNSFDYCFSFQCLEHTLEPTLHLREMRRVAKMGNFVSIPYREKTVIIAKTENRTAFDQHVFEFSPSDLEKIARHCGLKMRNSKVFNLESNTLSPIKRFYRTKAGFGNPSVLLAYFE